MASDYCDRTQVKAYLGLGATAYGDDDLLDAMIERASRIIDQMTRRWFYARTETRYFDHPRSTWELMLDADLLACTTLTVDSSAVDAANYYLYPVNIYPKQWIELHKGAAVSFLWTDTPQRSISIAGVWGYHDDYANAWEGSGDTVQNTTEISASGTTLTVVDGGNFAVRQTLLCESEQVLVTGISGNNLTVKRGHNGTTAAAHANGKALSIWRPPYDVQHIAIRLAAWLYQQKDAPFQRTANPQMGVVVVPAALPEDIALQIGAYRRGRVK